MSETKPSVEKITVIETSADASATDERAETESKPGKKLKLETKLTIKEIEDLIRG